MDFFNKDECFVCENRSLENEKDLPNKWIKPRLACRNHLKEAKIKNEYNLLDFLDKILPIEGSGLIDYLNPLWIGDKKCWGDYTAGFIHIFEEIYSSRNLFEYLLQHHNDYLDWLYEYYIYKKNDESANKNKEMSKRYYELMIIVSDRWASVKKMEILLEGVNVIEHDSFEKFYEIGFNDKYMNIVLPQDSYKYFFDESFQIANVRFNKF